jgi:flagellar FliJ protein
MTRFRLQRLLDLKQKREQELARQLAEAQREVDGARARHSELDTLRGDAAASLAGSADSGSRSVGELMSLTYSLQQLSEHVELQDERVKEAEASASERTGALQHAVQERRVLDRLREKHEELAKTTEQIKDRDAMDAIALTRFSTSQREKINDKDGD